MSKLNILFPLNDFLYLLQLEEYESARYAKLLPRFFFRRNFQVRDTLKNTKRIQQMRLVCIIVMLIVYVSLILQFPSFYVSFFLLLSLLLLTPLFVLITNILMTPIYEYLKHNKQAQAAKMIRSRPDLKIIAITGSYGKTTTKIAVYECLKNNYRVQYTPGNINTPTGIAQWIIDKLQPNTQLLIVEMDAYQRGEIAQSCSITPPDIALITNFGDQHLERFGNHENLILGYLEAFTQAKPEAILLISKDEYEKAKKHQSTQQILNHLNIHRFDINTSIPAEKQNIQNAKEIAEKLNVPPAIIEQAITNFVPPDRRGDIKQIDGYTVVDRSYNISESTAKQGVQEAAELAKKTGKHLVIITAGIPERGRESEQVNKEYGQFVKDYANYIIVLQSIYARAIEAGINDQAKIKKANRMHEAIALVKKESAPSEILLLIQPELTDVSY